MLSRMGSIGGFGPLEDTHKHTYIWTFFPVSRDPIGYNKGIVRG